MRTEFRKALEAALKSNSDSAGYEFYAGFLSDMGDGGFALPTAWLCPLDCIGKNGRKEGRKTLSVVLYLLESSEGLDSEGKDVAWDRMERIADSVFAKLEEDGNILSYDGWKCLPDEGAYSNYNDISIKVTCEITIGYCYE